MRKKLLLVIIIIVILCGISIFSIKIRNKKENRTDGILKQNEEIEPQNLGESKYGTEDKIIGNLEIKKINLNGPIKEGSSSKVLKEYIGHIEETPIYNGNVCLAAHNRGNKYSYFSRINELNKGDEITYTTDIDSKKYIVTETQEIDETDWKMLEDSNEDKITLITCIKNKRDKRLCVQAVKI